MRSMFGSRDKIGGTVPEEFAADIKIIKDTRDYTAEVVKYMEKMLRTATPSNAPNATNLGPPKVFTVQQDELQRMSRTCEVSMHLFYEQRYYYVLKTTGEICTQLSKRQKQMIQEIYERAMMPIKVWVEDDYPRFIRDLQRFQKLKKDRDAAVAALARQPTIQRESRANILNAQYDQQSTISRGEMEKTRKIRKHHESCFKLMATLHNKYSKSVLEEIEKAQTKLVRQLAELDEKDQKDVTVKTVKTERTEGKTTRSMARTTNSRKQ